MFDLKIPRETGHEKYFVDIGLYMRHLDLSAKFHLDGSYDILHDAETGTGEVYQVGTVDFQVNILFQGGFYVALKLGGIHRVDALAGLDDGFAIFLDDLGHID